MDRLVGKTSALQADNMEAGEPGAVAERDPKWNQVMLDAGETTDERMGANADELVRRSTPADIGEITDLAMPAQHHIVGENDALADAAIMPDMGVGQEHRARAHDRFGAATCGARIHRHAFPDDAILADHKADGFAAVFQVLRRVPDRSEGVNDRASSDRGVASQAHVGDKPNAVAKAGLRPNVAKWPNLDPCPQPRAVFGHGAGMDRFFHSRTSIADTSASQTSAPSTFASPRNHHMLRFLAMRVM